MRIKLIANGSDDFWNGIAAMLSDQIGEVSGSYKTDGNQFYSAVFADTEWTWIPQSYCQIIEEQAE